MKIQFKFLPKAERQRRPYNAKLLVFVILTWLTNAILSGIAWVFARGDEVTSIFGTFASLLVAAFTGRVLFRQHSQPTPEDPKQPGDHKFHFFSVGDVLFWLAAAFGVFEIVISILRMAE